MEWRTLLSEGVNFWTLQMEGVTEDRQKMPFNTFCKHFHTLSNTSTFTAFQPTRLDRFTLSTEMAVLMDLPDELLVLIASKISKPSDKLHLAQTNKRIHSIAIQLLYRHLTFYHLEYKPYPNLMRRTDTAFTPPKYLADSNAPQSNILRLAHMMQANTLPAGSKITSLTIIVNVNNPDNRIQTLTSLLLPQLTSLEHLTLRTIGGALFGLGHEPFSLVAFAAALSGTRQTLKSLDVHFALSPKHADGWTIGSLRHFSKLQSVSIQGSVLFGVQKSLPLSMPSLDAILPPGLKCLRLRWRTLQELIVIEVVLARFVMGSESSSRRRDKFRVHLECKDESGHDQRVADFFNVKVEGLNKAAEGFGLDFRLELEWKMKSFRDAAGA